MSETPETDETTETAETRAKAARARKNRRNRERGGEAEREAISILAHHGVPTSRSASAQASRYAKRTGQQQPDLVVADGHPLAGRLWVEVKSSPSQSVVWEGLRQACASGKPVAPLVMWRRPGRGSTPVRWLCATTVSGNGPFYSMSLVPAIAALDCGGRKWAFVTHGDKRCGLFRLEALAEFLNRARTVELPVPSIDWVGPGRKSKPAPEPEPTSAPATTADTVDWLLTTPATSADRYALIVGRMASAGWTFATLGEIMGCSRANAAARAKAWSSRTDADTVARVGALLGLTPEDWRTGLALSGDVTLTREVAAERYRAIPTPRNRPTDPTRCGPGRDKAPPPT